MEIKDTLRSNLLALLKSDAGGDFAPGENGTSRLAARANKKTSWGQRLLNDTDSSLSSLADAAKAFGLQPWQLLVPNLDPARLPALSGDSSAWPFPMVSREEYEQLPHDHRVCVQSKLDSAISRLRLWAFSAGPRSRPLRCCRCWLIAYRLTDHLAAGLAHQMPPRVEEVSEVHCVRVRALLLIHC